SYKNLNIIGKNSNIIIDEKYKLLANNYEIRVREDEKYINLKYKDNEFTLKQSKDKKIDIYTNELSDEFVNAIFNKSIFKDGKLIFLANGSLDKLNGKIIIKNSNIEDLAILNNLLVFIHTSPALINPLLAIPSVVGMATNSGFNLTAYKIINGIVEFEYSQKENIFEIKKLVTIGNGIDFEGKGKIDLNDMVINSEIKLIFLKDYSKIVGAIPVVSYVLLGDSNRVETQVNISGDLSNPSISTNLTKETFSIPMNITKRIFSTPSMLFDFLSGKKSEEDIKNEENRINKPLEE
ncbi:AsmA-like C-terminal domain-containing protein, partial [Arcobacter aquimarinus]